MLSRVEHEKSFITSGPGLVVVMHKAKSLILSLCSSNVVCFIYLYVLTMCTYAICVCPGFEVNKVLFCSVLF